MKYTTFCRNKLRLFGKSKKNIMKYINNIDNQLDATVTAY